MLFYLAIAAALPFLFAMGKGVEIIPISEYVGNGAE